MDEEGLRLWLDRLDKEGIKIPPRYTEAGIRKLNPDLPWSENLIMEGEPPEVLSVLNPAELEELRQKILLHHPNKMTEEEKQELKEIECRMVNCSAGPRDKRRHRQLLDDIGKRDIDIDEW